MSIKKFLIVGNFILFVIVIAQKSLNTHLDIIIIIILS